MSTLSPQARRRALWLRRERILRKIERLKAELADAEVESGPQSALFLRGDPRLQPLRDRLAQLRELAARIETELRRRG